MLRTKKRKNIYKFGIPILATATVATPLSLLVSCGTNDLNFGQSWKFGSHRVVQFLDASPQGRNEFEVNENHESLFFTPLGEVTNVTATEALNASMLSLFRTVKDQTDTVQRNDGVVQKVIGNRSSKLRFELVDGFTIIGTNGSDKLEIKNDSLTELEAQRHGFDWSQSINHVEQDGSLSLLKFIAEKGMKELQFNFKENMQKKHWIQQTTGKQGPLINPIEDFYTGMKYTLFSSDLTAQKFSNLKMNEFNDACQEFMTNNFFQNGNNPKYYPPTASSVDSLIYMDRLSFGFDIDPLLDSSKKSEMVSRDSSGRSVLKLNFNADNDSLASLFENYFINDKFSVAVSSEEIQNLHNKYDSIIENGLTKKFGQEFSNKFLSSQFFESGRVQSIAANRLEHYIAGQYYISNSNISSLTFEQNPEYIDERWLNQKNANGELITIKTYMIKFIDNSNPQMKLSLLNEYKIGTNFLTTYFDSLSTQEKIQALNNDRNWGLNYSIPYTSKSTLLGDYTMQQLLPLLPKNINGNIFFNDNYAKLMWGKSLKDLKQDSTSHTGDVMRNIFSGSGMQFRTNLYAAINDYSFITQVFGGSSTEWTSFFSPEGMIKNNVFPSQALQSLPKVDGINFTQTDVDKIKGEIDLVKPLLSKFALQSSSNNSPASFHEVERQSYVDSYNLNNSMGPSNSDLNMIKQNIKNALDLAQIPMDQKVTWEFSFGRGNASQVLNSVYTYLFKFVNSLDPRLELVAQVKPVKELSSNDQMSVVVDYPNAGWSNSIAIGSSDKPWVQRIFDSGTGYNAGSIFTKNSYDTSSPASPIIKVSKILQTGVLFGLSYYSDNNGGSYFIDKNQLSALGPIIESFKQGLSEFKSRFFKPDVFKSNKGSEYLQKIQSIDFSQLWKSNTLNLATNGILGFLPLETMGNEYEALNERKNLTPDEQLNLDDLNKTKELFDQWFNISQSILVNKFHSMNASEVVKSMTAFQIMAPSNIQPYGSHIGNREKPRVDLIKSWLTRMSPNLFGNVSIGRFFVDLDDINKDGRVDWLDFSSSPWEIY